VRPAAAFPAAGRLCGRRTPELHGAPAWRWPARGQPVHRQAPTDLPAGRATALALDRHAGGPV
jgi:hypothetical protein